MKVPVDFSMRSLEKIIESDFPDFHIETIEFLDDSWDNVVVEINSEYIFRFPKEAERRFFVELKVLEKLQRKITLTIPYIEFVGRSYNYSGYKKIKGNHMSHEIWQNLHATEKSTFISDVSQFLKEVHSSFGFEEAQKLEVEKENPESYVTLAQTIFSSKFQNQKVLAIVSKVIREYQEMIKEEGEIVFLYNDLHTENMAFDTAAKKLRGIFDFGDVALGDINRDFEPLYKFDPEVTKKVIKKYEELTGKELSFPRVFLYACMNEVCDLAEFINKPNSSVYKNAVERLLKWRSEI